MRLPQPRSPAGAKSCTPGTWGYRAAATAAWASSSVAQVGQHQTIHAGVQRLLDHPLVALAGVRRNPDHRHHVGLQVALLGNPFAVQQHLQGGTQGGEAKTLVFHFNDDRVVVGISNVGQVIQTAVRDRAGAENRLAVLEEVDDLVVAHLLSHVFPLPVSGLAAGLSLYPSLSLL